MRKFNNQMQTYADLHREFLIWDVSDKNLRFGQYLVNKYGTCEWGELFYEELPYHAYAIAYNEIDKHTLKG